MAREQVKNDDDFNSKYNTNNKMAVVYLRGELLDEGTYEARKNAGAKGCMNIFLRNEKYYDNSEKSDRVLPVDYCYTDDPQIAKEYKEAGIEVIDLAPLPKQSNNVQAVKAANEAKVLADAKEAKAELAKAESEKATLEAKLAALEAENQGLQNAAQKAKQAAQNQTSNQGGGSGNSGPQSGQKDGKKSGNGS